MGNLYGTIRPANIDIVNDVEMFYYYRPTRSTESLEFSGGFKVLDNTNLVKQYKEDDVSPNDILGLYELRLPLDKFNMKGFYTIYIRPKEVSTILEDVSVLVTYPDVKGVVLNLSDFSETDLTGYRIDYLDEAGNRTNVSRLITSCNRCEPVMVSISDSYPKVTRYRLTDNTNNLVFCTVTPSSASSVKPNVEPFIGLPGGRVIVSNTKFDPKMIEIEMVDHDADTITYMLEGDQIRNRDNAIITTYNENNEIYKQQDYYTIKDELGNPLYDVKKNRENIDISQEYDKVVDNI